jgi:hypothetical protein
MPANLIKTLFWKGGFPRRSHCESERHWYKGTLFNLRLEILIRKQVIGKNNEEEGLTNFKLLV